MFDRLLELNEKYRTLVRECAQATECALGAVNDPWNAKGIADLEGLELQLARQAETNELRERMGEARAEGFDAAKAGLQKELNPHHEGSYEYLFWYKGWCAARNIMPFIEVPMERLFELDRPVRQFSRDFSLVSLLDAIAHRSYVASGQTAPWGTLHPYAKKHFMVMAVQLLEGLMDRSAMPQAAPPAFALESPPLTIFGNAGS